MDQAMNTTANPVTSPTSPEITVSDASASFDWVTDACQRYALAGPDLPDTVVMGVCWGLGLVGAPVRAVEAVLSSEKAQPVIASILALAARMKDNGELPPWCAGLVEMPLEQRTQVAKAAEASLTDRRTVRVHAGDSAMFAALRHHPDAQFGPDRQTVEVPAGAVRELARAAQTVTSRDVRHLLRRARPAFRRRLDQAVDDAVRDAADRAADPRPEATPA